VRLLDSRWLTLWSTRGILSYCGCGNGIIAGFEESTVKEEDSRRSQESGGFGADSFTTLSTLR
jgi:hypothetical protein